MGGGTRTALSERFNAIVNVSVYIIYVENRRALLSLNTVIHIYTLYINILRASPYVSRVTSRYRVFFSRRSSTVFKKEKKLARP